MRGADGSAVGTGVSTAGSLFVDSASPDGTEEPALASGEPVEVLVPGSAEQLEQAASVLEAHALVVSDAATALTRVEVTGWRGTARDAYDVVAGEQPRRWSIASAALSAAAQAIRAYAAHLAPARAVATEAVWLYQQYLALEASLEALTLDPGGRPPAGDTGLVGYRAARLLDADAVGQTGSGIAPAGGMILGPTATTLIPALARDADAVRRQAIATLVRARGIMRQAGTVAAEQLRRATAEAPEARRAWESTIRPAAAEHAGHVALDAASFAPWPVGLGAAALNTGWYVAAGHRTDAAYAAAGVVPLVGKGLKEGLVAREVADDAAQLLHKSVTTQAAERISSGHAWSKHVVAKGEFPEVTSPDEFAVLIEDVMLHGESRLSIKEPGKVYFWKDDILVVSGPQVRDTGTAFRPTQGRSYFLRQE